MSTWSMTEDLDVLKNIIQQVILEKNLLSNKEQLRAFEMVAQHVCFEDEANVMGHREVCCPLRSRQSFACCA